jgi:Polyketide cyclase / dehydrase and lipid transport/TIR domain
MTASIMIERPIMEVFDYVRDPNRMPEWVPAYSAVMVPDDFDWKDPENCSFGIAIGIDPWRIRDQVTCFDMVAGRSISFRNHTIFPQMATYTFEPTSRGTIVTATHIPWGLGVLVFKPFMGFLRPWVEDMIKQGLTQLKQRLESLRFVRPKRRIFFSYRREIDKYEGGRVCEAMEREFGEGAIFRDVDSIRSGSWESRIETALKSCSVFVAFIGPRWFEVLEKRRSLGRKDFVLEEIRMALGLEEENKLKVLPLLVQDALREGTTLEEELTAFPEISALAKQQFYRLRPDPDFRSDMERVVISIWETIVDEENSRRTRRSASEPTGP